MTAQWYDRISKSMKPIIGPMYPVEMPPFTAGHTFVACRRQDRKTGWCVIHLETGRMAWWGKTRERAVKEAFDRVAFFGEAGFLKAIEKARTER